MQESTSELIRALRIFLIIGLVFVHFGPYPDSTLDPNSGIHNAEYIGASALNSFLLYVFLSSVPILSAISGYLLCFNGAPKLFPALRKRALTIVLPAFLWTSLWLLLAFVLYRIGQASGQFTYYDYGFNNFNWLTFLNGTIGVTEEPFAIQFWFVHDLVLSIAVSPAVYWLVKRVPAVYFIVIAAAWLAGIKPPVFFQLKVLAFFSLGVLLAQKSWQPKTDMPAGMWVLGLFLLLVMGRVVLPVYFDGKMPLETAYELLVRISGAYAILALMMKIRVWLPATYQWLVRHSGYAFFLHCAHFPPVIIIKQIVGKIGLAGGELKLMALLGVTPLLTVAVVLASAKFMQRFTPRVYRFFNGQRSI